MTTPTVLLKRDLPGFEKEAFALVDEMQQAGWTARRTSKGHVQLFAPDGVTTYGFGPSESRNRNIKNARAFFQRWQRRQAAPEPQKEVTTVPIERFVCDHPDHGKGGKEFKTARSLAIHRSSHDRSQVACPRCGRLVVYLDSHIKKAHQHDPHKVLESLMDLLDELEKLRAEREELINENIRLRNRK